MIIIRLIENKLIKLVTHRNTLRYITKALTLWDSNQSFITGKNFLGLTGKSCLSWDRDVFKLVSTCPFLFCL